MYPTLSDLIYYLTGIQFIVPVSTFTFFLMLATLCGYLILWSELKRKEKKRLIEGFYDSRRIYIKPHLLAWTLVIISLICGFAGSRLLSIFQNPSPFFEAPLHTLFSLQGSIFFGGLILAFFGTFLYANDRRLKLVHLLDAMAPALTLAYAIGRLGCHISGEWLCGKTNTLEKPRSLNFIPDWLWTYENNPSDLVSMRPIFPTHLYEVGICAIIFLTLWSLRKKAIPGTIFSLYLLLYGLERFLIEQLRTEDNYHLIHLFFKQAQVFSLSMVIVGCLVFYISHKQHKGKLHLY